MDKLTGLASLIASGIFLAKQGEKDNNTKNKKTAIFILLSQFNMKPGRCKGKAV